MGRPTTAIGRPGTLHVGGHPTVSHQVALRVEVGEVGLGPPPDDGAAVGESLEVPLALGQQPSGVGEGLRELRPCAPWCQARAAGPSTGGRPRRRAVIEQGDLAVAVGVGVVLPSERGSRAHREVAALAAQAPDTAPVVRSIL